MTDEELKHLVAANARAISELRESIGELRISTSESTSELRESISELRKSTGESTSELRESISELRTSTGELRESISALRDIVVGHERRIIRLEGKEVDTWGDYLTLLDRVRKLEEWKRKLEGEDGNGQHD